MICLEQVGIDIIVPSECRKSIVTLEMTNKKDIPEKPLVLADVIFFVHFNNCLCRIDLCFLKRTCVCFHQERSNKLRKPTQNTCWNCERRKPRNRKKLCSACSRILDPEISQGMAYQAGFPIIALKHSPWTRRPGGIKAYKVNVLRIFCMQYECECLEEINKRFERRRSLGRTIMALYKGKSAASASFDLRFYLQSCLL